MEVAGECVRCSEPNDHEPGEGRPGAHASYKLCEPHKIEVLEEVLGILRGTGSRRALSF